MEHQQFWVENQKRQDKLEQRLEQKIEEDRQKWAENQQLWAENQQKWKEHERQMETNHQQMNAKIDTVFSKVDQKLGAIGARWGIQSEASFRKALAGILKDFEGIEVIHVDEHDDQGTVFGYPEEIELDLIIKNGVLMIAEMKSSVEKFHIALFERKVHFYEQKHNRQANRKIVISPTVNDKAMLLAKQLGIEVYTYVQDVNL